MDSPKDQQEEYEALLAANQRDAREAEDDAALAHANLDPNDGASRENYEVASHHAAIARMCRPSFRWKLGKAFPGNALPCSNPDSALALAFAHACASRGLAPAEGASRLARSGHWALRADDAVALYMGAEDGGAQAVNVKGLQGFSRWGKAWMVTLQAPDGTENCLTLVGSSSEIADDDPCSLSLYYFQGPRGADGEYPRGALTENPVVPARGREHDEPLTVDDVENTAARAALRRAHKKLDDATWAVIESTVAAVAAADPTAPHVNSVITPSDLVARS